MNATTRYRVVTLRLGHEALELATCQKPELQAWVLGAADRARFRDAANGRGAS